MAHSDSYYAVYQNVEKSLSELSNRQAFDLLKAVASRYNLKVVSAFTGFQQSRPVPLPKAKGSSVSQPKAVNRLPEVLALKREIEANKEQILSVKGEGLLSPSHDLILKRDELLRRLASVKSSFRAQTSTFGPQSVQPKAESTESC
jgi:hypothetical protein